MQERREHALILAAGLGRRLGGADAERPPKVLLRFAGRTLLERHLLALGAAGVKDATIGIGYRGAEIEAELARLSPPIRVQTVVNPAHRQGSITTLFAAREALRQDRPIVLMDADVLYDRRLIERLLCSAHPSCALLDRNIEAGEEPVKLAVRDGRAVDLAKHLEDAGAFFGESVGFFRLSPAMAQRLAEIVERRMREGRAEEPHEEALRELVREPRGEGFGVEDITGLSWIEIDFAEDIRRAEREILPRIAAPAR